jgi:hypothetical protein
MVSNPKRIQRERTKGWRMPQGAIYVGRPSKWGNTWKVDDIVADGGPRQYRPRCRVANPTSGVLMAALLTLWSRILQRVLDLLDVPHIDRDDEEW